MTHTEIEALIRRTNAVPFETGFRARPQRKADADLLGQHKDEVKAYIIAREAERKAAAEAHQTRIRQNIPGIDELREAIEANRRQRAAFERAMDSESGRLPAVTKFDLDAVRAAFPRAAAYVKAESYAGASWDVKADAGRKAMGRLEAGEDHALVLADMDKALTGGYID